MAIICSVDYNTAFRYKGCNLSTKYNNKKHKVYLKLICDDLTLTDSIALAKGSKNILMVDYQGLDTNPVYMNLQSDTGVYIGRLLDFGADITREDIARVMNDTPTGITPIINLPKDYNNLEFLWQVSKEFPKVRFCGGHLFAVDGIKLGAIGVDILTKAEVKFTMDSYLMDGTIDVLENVDINTLDIDTTSKSEKVTRSKSSSSSSSAKTSSKKNSISYLKLLMGKV